MIPAGTVVGRYRLERLLGEGGMGVVYAARHLDLGKPAAVKILNERYAESAEMRARFVREGQAAARVRHPNIVDVYDVGVEGGRAYLVMELLEGEDLRRLIAREGPLSPQRAADLLVPVVSALAAAHDAGVIHRDLKPDNVFLARERDTFAPRVLDFGISKLAGIDAATSLTGSGALLGTPFYLSPEQARNASDIDARADQYACGVILYECVTGRRPVDEPSIYQLLQRIVHGDFAPPRQLDPTLPAAFERLILQAMAIDPGRRFPSTRAFGLALLEFAGERARADYSSEFTRGAGAATPTAPVTVPAGVFALGTTLSDSPQERDAPRSTTRGKRPSLVVLGTLLLVAGLVAALVWRIAEHTGAGESAAFNPAAGSALAMENMPPGEVVSAPGKLAGLNSETIMARARKAGFTIQLTASSPPANPGTSWAFFLAHRENDVLSAQLYHFETETLVDPLMESLKGNRGAQVARDRGSVFAVLGGPMNRLGQPSSAAFRKALLDAVVK